MNYAKLNIKKMKVADLKPHPLNDSLRMHPKKGSPAWEGLRKSLENHYFDPLVFNSRNGMLVSGHLRAKILSEIGCEFVDVQVEDLSDEEHIAMLISANKLIGDPILSGLKDALESLDTGGFDMDLTGYTELERERLATQFYVGGSTDPNAEWEGMPDYESQNKLGEYQTVVHFATMKDADDFFKLIERPKKKYMWWPQSDGVQRQISNKA